MENQNRETPRAIMMREKRKRQKRLQKTVAILMGILILILVGCLLAKNKDAETTKDNNTNAEVPNKENQPGDIFDGAVFIGNSYVETLKNYNLPKSGQFLSRVGLTVETVFEKSVTDDDKTAIVVLGEKKYEKILLAFGENELGWSYPHVFIEKYSSLVKAVKKEQPKSKIYILGILPIRESDSEENKENVNNARIREYNERLRIMADNSDVAFIPPPTALMTASCALMDDASTDGVHLKYEYNKIWIDSIKKYLEHE